ncbi:MAG: hypothetical protein IK080_04180 [Clostridia bacterium]|nr:hypothetical protein [Clostridia bacterium]
MTHADFWKTLFDFALVVLAVLSVVFEKRLIAFEKRIGQALRRRIRSRKAAAEHSATADRCAAAPHRAALPHDACRPAAPVVPRPCPAMPSPHRVA